MVLSFSFLLERLLHPDVPRALAIILRCLPTWRCAARLIRSACRSSEPVDKYLVVGLGNPGPGYIHTRHNAGFYFLDAFAGAQGWRFAAARMQGEAAQGRLGGAQLCCVKPQTFMNHSGLCVRRYLDYFDIPLARLIVLHDDLDLAAGRIKVMRGWRSGRPQWHPLPDRASEKP